MRDREKGEAMCLAYLDVLDLERGAHAALLRVERAALALAQGGDRRTRGAVGAWHKGLVRLRRQLNGVRAKALGQLNGKETAE